MRKSTSYVGIIIFTSIVLLLTIIVYSFGDFKRNVSLTYDYMQGGIKRFEQNKNLIFENRVFDEKNIIETSYNEYNINKTGIKQYNLEILSFQRPKIEQNKAIVNGPFGFKISFKKAKSIDKYGFNDELGVIVKRRKVEDIKEIDLINYNESYIYISKKINDEFIVIGEISNDKWNNINENNGIINIRNDKSLIQDVGQYQIVILLKKYTFEKVDNVFTMINNEFIQHTYEIEANTDENYNGILKKNDSQKNYVFQVSMNIGNSMIVPSNEKLEIKYEQEVKLNIISSHRYLFKEVKISIYKLDEYTREEKLCKTVDVPLNSDYSISHTLDFDYSDLKSGLYKIVVSAYGRPKLFNVKSFSEFFDIFKYHYISEEYEYYFKIGDVI